MYTYCEKLPLTTSCKDLYFKQITVKSLTFFTLTACEGNSEVFTAAHRYSPWRFVKTEEIERLGISYLTYPLFFTAYSWSSHKRRFESWVQDGLAKVTYSEVRIAFSDTAAWGTDEVKKHRRKNSCKLVLGKGVFYRYKCYNLMPCCIHFLFW